MQALNTFAAGDSNYIAKLNQDNAAIKAAIDALEALSGGATNIQAAVVPKGLKYIFDRKGIIGKASYQPTAATLTGPNYSLTIASGGFWDGSALAYSDSNNYRFHVRQGHGHLLRDHRFQRPARRLQLPPVPGRSGNSPIIARPMW